MLLEILRPLTTLYTTLSTYWNTMTWSPVPIRRRRLDDTTFVEEWIDIHGQRRNLIRTGLMSPFEKKARCPWIWVGHEPTEEDYTRLLERYLVVGNRITPQLIKQLTGHENLTYIEQSTFNELKFPEEGLIIDELV